MKKSILAILLVAVMAASLLPMAALADEAVYEVNVVADDPEYIKPSDTYRIGYFYFTTSSCVVYRDGVKLNSKEYSITSIDYASITYRVKGTNAQFVNVPNDMVEKKSTYFTIDLSNDTGDTFAANSYEIKAVVTVNGKYTPTDGEEETFACQNVEAVFELVVAPDITGLTLAFEDDKIVIDYENQGKDVYQIPVTIESQDGTDVAGFCDMVYSKDNGVTYNSVPLMKSDDGFVVQLYPFAAGILEDTTLMFKAIYEGVDSAIESGVVSVEAEVTNQASTAFAKFNGKYYSDLGEAITDALATSNESETIEILRDVYIAGCNYVFNKNLTFYSANDATVTAYVKAVDKSTPGYENYSDERIDEINRDMVAFSIGEGKTLTLDGVFFVIEGNVDKDENGNAVGYDGTALAAYKGAKLMVMEGGLTLSGLNRGTTAGDNNVEFSFAESFFNVDKIDGNLSNGGNVLFYYSSAVISNVGNYGLSVTSLSLNNSTVSMENVAYSAIFCNGGGIDLAKSNINIVNCGSGLPYSGYTKADYVVDYNDLRTGMNVRIDDYSTLSISGSNTAANYVNIGAGRLSLFGTLNAGVKYDNANSCMVLVDGKVYCIVNAGDIIVLPAAPTRSGYAFLGWSDGTTTYDALATVTITKNTTFTAVWVQHPDTPYVPEPEDPSEPVTPVFPFYDVSTSAWYYSAVKYVYDNGLMDGVDTYVFAPNDTLTRAMVWTIIARMSGVDTTGGNTWYAKAQEWVVVNGISDGENPTAAITREQLVTMLYRYAQIKGYDVSVGENTNILSYVDATSISEYAVAAFQWACGSGLTEGDENGALTPLATATRAQAAAMIMRFCQSVK